MGVGEGGRGLARATRLNASHSRRSRRGARPGCGPRRPPGRCRSWRTAGPGPTGGGATSTGSIRGPGRRWTSRARPRAARPPASPSPSAGPVPGPALGLAPHHHGSPLHRRRRAASAWLISRCWGMPNSAQVGAGRPRPDRSATSRPGSGEDQLPWGTAMQAISIGQPGEPASARARGPRHQLGRGGAVARCPTPTSTGVGGSRAVAPVDRHRSPVGEAARRFGCPGVRAEVPRPPAAARRWRIIRPTSRQLTGDRRAPGRSRARSGRS